MENKERIMLCAEELFYSRGYDATGVQEIVERAGVTKPTLYYYFGSKKGLLDAIFKLKFEGLTPILKEISTQPEEIRLKLYSLATVYHTFFAKEYKMFRLLLALYYSARENEAYQTAKPYFNGFYEIVIRMFEESSAELGNMHGRQRLFAVNYIGVLNQYLSFSLDETAENYVVTEGQIHAMVDQFMHGIFS